MEALWQDLKYAVRTLLRSRGFTAVAVISLALGIGANAAIFSLINAVFLSPLPVCDASSVLQVYTIDQATTTTGPNVRRTGISMPNFEDFRDQNDVFSGVAAFANTGVTLTGHGEPRPYNVTAVSAAYFDVLG